MAEPTVMAGSLLYSHIIPPLMGFIGVILICTGIMDRQTKFTIFGVVLFLMAGILPFLILPLVMGA